MNARITAMENLIASDPGGRNVFGLAIPDQLRLAAQSLRLARRVGIVSGFFIPDAGAGETDGPPGAFALGRALCQMGIVVDYITDRYNATIFSSLGVAPVIEPQEYVERASDPVKFNPQGSPHYAQAKSNEVTHLVSIERCARGRDGRYRNMCGDDITATTPPLDEHFLRASHQGVTTIGIGDGGNEIGMGKVFAAALDCIPHGKEIASTVPADFCIAAGVSNWGAYGLVGALSVFAGRDLLPTPDECVAAIEACVRAGAVDGRTCRREPTVDGLPAAASLRMLEEIRRLITPSPLESGRRLCAGVIGYGETGRAAAQLLHSRGHRVRVSEQSPVLSEPQASTRAEQPRGDLRRAGAPADNRQSAVDNSQLPDCQIAKLPEHLIDAFEKGRHTLAFFTGCDLVIPSPGVRPDSQIIYDLHRAGIPLMSELEMASQLCERPMIAVTGSVGKRTTVELMQRLFADCGRRLDIGGNRGLPLSSILAHGSAMPCGTGGFGGELSRTVPPVNDPNNQSPEIFPPHSVSRASVSNALPSVPRVGASGPFGPQTSNAGIDEALIPIALAVSSYQLESVVHFRPRIAVLLNIQEAFVDRHGSLAEYIRIKSRVFMNQHPDDILILPYDDDRLRVLARKHHGRTFFISGSREVDRGAWLANSAVRVNVDGSVEETTVRLPPAKQFLENLLAAILVRRLLLGRTDEVGHGR